LDLLPPESAPAGAFEVMTVRSLSKAALHQVLSAAAISLGGATQAFGLCAHDQIVVEVAGNRAASLRPRALTS
jgi:hypothetical protein